MNDEMTADDFLNQRAPGADVRTLCLDVARHVSRDSGEVETAAALYRLVEHVMSQAARWAVVPAATAASSGAEPRDLRITRVIEQVGSLWLERRRAFAMLVPDDLLTDLQQKLSVAGFASRVMPSSPRATPHYVLLNIERLIMHDTCVSPDAGKLLERQADLLATERDGLAAEHALLVNKVATLTRENEQLRALMPRIDRVVNGPHPTELKCPDLHQSRESAFQAGVRYERDRVARTLDLEGKFGTPGPTKEPAAKRTSPIDGTPANGTPVERVKAVLVAKADGATIQEIATETQLTTEEVERVLGADELGADELGADEPGGLAVLMDLYDPARYRLLPTPLVLPELQRACRAYQAGELNGLALEVAMLKDAMPRELIALVMEQHDRGVALHVALRQIRRTAAVGGGEACRNIIAQATEALKANDRPVEKSTPDAAERDDIAELRAENAKLRQTEVRLYNRATFLREILKAHEADLQGMCDQGREDGSLSASRLELQSSS